MSVLIADGLEFLSHPRDRNQTIKLLHVFDGQGQNILLSMADTRQYYLRKSNHIVAILSLKDRGTARNETRIMTNMLYNLCTDPKWQGRGLMTTILRRVIADCCRQGKKRLHLEVLKTNTPAIRLYQKLGFRYVRDTIHGDSIIMRLSLRDTCPWQAGHKEADGLPRSVSQKGRARHNFDPAGN